MKAPLASATPLLAALLWIGALLVDPGPLAPASVLLVGVGVLLTTTVAVVGMVLAGGRWARRSALAMMLFTLAIAAVRPLDVLWVVSLIATVIAGAALFSPAVTGSIRKLPAAAGPPERAVLLPLLLLGMPALIGLAAWDDPVSATMVVGLGAPLAALWYSRVLPGGLLAVRVVWPALAIGLALLQSLPAGVVSLLGGCVVAGLAWHPSVKVAFHPPRETGTSYPIPPELTPKEILDAAGLDERGRPLQ